MEIEGDHGAMSFKSWIRGEFRSKQMKTHVLISTGGITAFLVMSYRYYIRENAYSMFTHLISDLGNWQANPKGWWIFSLAMVFTGIMTYPIINYIEKNLEFMNKQAISIGAWTLRANAIGTIIIGCIPLVREPTGLGISFYDLHAIFTYLSLICYFIGMGCWVEFFIKHPKISPNNFPETQDVRPKFNFTPILPLIVLFIIISLLALITQFFSEYLWIESLEKFYAREFWEWMLFYSYFLVNYPLALFIAAANKNDGM